MIGISGRAHRSYLLGISLRIESCCLKWQLESILLSLWGVSLMVSLSFHMCWPHAGGSLALPRAFAVKNCQDAGDAGAEPVLRQLPREERCWGIAWLFGAVWHQATVWVVQSRVQKEQSESCYGAVPHNNIGIPQHHSVLWYWPGLVGQRWDKLCSLAFHFYFSALNILIWAGQAVGLVQ